MATSHNIPIPHDDWVNVTQISGFSGNYQIQNITRLVYPKRGAALMFQSATKPDSSSFDGSRIFPPVYGFVSVAQVSGSAPVWMRAEEDSDVVTISVSG